MDEPYKSFWLVSILQMIIKEVRWTNSFAKGICPSHLHNYHLKYQTTFGENLGIELNWNKLNWVFCRWNWQTPLSRIFSRRSNCLRKPLLGRTSRLLFIWMVMIYHLDHDHLYHNRHHHHLFKTEQLFEETILGAHVTSALYLNGDDLSSWSWSSLS